MHSPPLAPQVARSTSLLVVCAVVAAGLASCGSESDPSASQPIATFPGAASAGVPTTALASTSTAPAPVTTAPAPASSAATPTDIVEPELSSRPAIAVQGVDTRVALPNDTPTAPSSVTVRLVRIEDGNVPFIELDKAELRAPDNSILSFTIDGGRLQKSSANTGGTVGARLMDEEVASGFRLAVWVEDLDGRVLIDPTEVDVAGIGETDG